ncbi:von Willebrand factor A domain-containing protein 9 isoform X2 [Sigmodon hispidus]
MPTVVVMDVSLFMTRPVSVERSEEYQHKHLAAHCLTMLFEYMATNYKLEFTALVVFSSLWELKVPFTRHYNTLQEALSNMDDYNKTCLESALVVFAILCTLSKEGDEVGTDITDDNEDENSANQIAGKIPNFCVLLHGTLKVEGMVAIMQLGPEWCGMLYSQADNKKKSNLMMSLFEPAPEPLPWLGKMAQLGPLSDAKENPYGEDDKKNLFPLKPQNKQSYALNVTGSNPTAYRQMYRRSEEMQGSSLKKHRHSIRS